MRLESMKPQSYTCSECPARRGVDFCIFLPWNETNLHTPIEKYITWQGQPCSYFKGQLPLCV